MAVFFFLILLPITSEQTNTGWSEYFVINIIENIKFKTYLIPTSLATRNLFHPVNIIMSNGSEFTSIYWITYERIQDDSA